MMYLYNVEIPPALASVGDIEVGDGNHSNTAKIKAVCKLQAVFLCCLS